MVTSPQVAFMSNLTKWGKKIWGIFIQRRCRSLNSTTYVCLSPITKRNIRTTVYNMNFNNILLRSAVFRNRIGASKQTLFPTQISRRAFTSSRRGLQQQSSQSTPQTEKPNSTFKDGVSLIHRPSLNEYQ